MEADGTDPRKIAEGGEPNWSPHLHPHQRGIALIDVDRVLAGDEAAVQILTRTEADVPEEAPAWSPNGERIAFTSHRSGSSDIWMVDIDGGDLHNLTPEPSLESAASWSPDGRHIVFGSNRAASSVEGGDLFTMRPDGTDPQRLTDEGLSYRPAWSPDGRWIAFNSQRDGDSEVYAMHPDGTGQRRLTAHPETDGLPAWVGRCDSQT
jgi:Tol biopolymer transport system component